MDTTTPGTPPGTLCDAELDQIAARLENAAPERWKSYLEGRDRDSGSSFIQTPSSDIELTGATVADQDFIAHARQDLARLLAEIRRLRAIRPGPRVEIKQLYVNSRGNADDPAEQKTVSGDRPSSSIRSRSATPSRPE